MGARLAYWSTTDRRRGRWGSWIAVGGAGGSAPVVVHDRSLEGLKAQNEVRATLLQGLGGVVLLVGVYFTYRQLRTTREGQITERYTRAIDQLGHDQLDVRLGGIYALERIARDSVADRATIGEVLTAFVRSHAPWPPRLPGQYVAAAPIDQVPELQVRAPDVQASLTVLGRGNFARARGDLGDRLDLHASDLRHAQLRGAHLQRANLSEAHLEGADLNKAHLEGANLRKAHLEGALLALADLEGADLTHANLEEAFFFGAHLEGADLAETNLERAGLGGANLEGAYLSGANLEGAFLGSAHLERATLRDARLEDADLEGTLADEHTRWPDAFDWRAAGVIVAGEDASSS